MASLFLLDALTFLIVRGWHGRNLQWSAQSQATETCIYPIRPVGHMFHLWHWFQRSRHRFGRPRALCADSVRCMFLNPGSQRSLRDELHFVGLRPCWFLIVSIISSILSCGLIIISSATVVAKEDDDGERFEFITTLLRRMAARGAEFSTAAACDNSVVRAGAIPMADHEGLKQ